MELEAALARYLEVAELRPRTREKYRYILRRFIAWLAQIGIVTTGELELAHLRAWLAFLKSVDVLATGHPGRLDLTTLHHYAVVTKIFVRWLEREEIIAVPISLRFQLPKRPRKAPAVLSSANVQELLAAGQEQHPKRPWATEALTARNRAIVTVFVDTGLRRQELAGLRLCDIDYEGLLLHVAERKGGRGQAVPISSEAMDVLDEYLAQYRPVLARGVRAKRTDIVFLNGKGTPLAAHGISKLFGRLSSQVAIEDKQVSPHALRRYMATTQLAMGRDSLHVQRQMGHSSLSTTNLYVQLSTEQLRASHETYSPLRVVREARPERPYKQYWQDEE